MGNMIITTFIIIIITIILVFIIITTVIILTFIIITIIIITIGMEKRGYRSCIQLGKTGCEANNAKCCRQGNPWTGTMRKCVNTGSSDKPEYTCRERKGDEVLEAAKDELLKRGNYARLGETFRRSLKNLKIRKRNRTFISQKFKVRYKRGRSTVKRFCLNL